MKTRARTVLAMVLTTLLIAALTPSSASAWGWWKKKPAVKTPEVSQAELIQMAPFLGYLEVHKNVESPFTLLGGPIKVTVTQTEGGVHVALPDYRRLDPRVFGIPQLPRAFAGTPIITGVPPALRGVEGDRYTKLKDKSPFGHANQVMPDGRYSLEALDATATDAAQTKDTVKMEASWKDEKGNTYGVRCHTPAPHGVEYPSFGGVMTNHILHGSSRIGTPLMPTEFVYVAFWGMGETRKNDKVLDSGVIVHCMLTEYVRTKDYELAFDDQITPTRLQMHLIVPPMVVKDGKFAKQPVKTGFKLPNGQELPFWHVMFANLEIKAERTGASSTLKTAGGSDPDGNHVVLMTNQLKFEPAKITIPTGATVEWKSDSSLVHTVTDVPDLAVKKSDAALPKGAKPFNSGDMPPGQIYSHTFKVAGTYKYFCIPHEADGMVGEVVVTEGK